eukprot:gene42718-56784_t
MAPRRKKSDLILKSIWDEILLTNYLAENGANTRHAKKIWNWMLAHPDVPLNDVPLETWSVPKVVADGTMGIIGDLTSSEILEQLIH